MPMSRGWRRRALSGRLTVGSGVENVFDLAFVVWSVLMLLMGFATGYVTGRAIRERWGDGEREHASSRT